MNNKYLRLFVAQTRIMTAEKMKLDRFCQHGEYFAYRIALPHDPSVDLLTTDDIRFTFEIDLEDKQYRFDEETIAEDGFAEFEQHLSVYLNALFQRKLEFEQQNGLFKEVMQKLVHGLTEEEQQCLATHIDANTTNVLRALGVKSETL